MDLLRGEFGEHFISRSGPVNWPPRSCDLTSLDYFLCGYVKAHVYTHMPASIDALEENIEAFIREIPAEMLETECQHWTKRMDHLRRNHGQHLHEIIFKHLIIWTVLSIQIKISCIFLNFMSFFYNFPIAPLQEMDDRN